MLIIACPRHLVPIVERAVLKDIFFETRTHIAFVDNSINDGVVSGRTRNDINSPSFCDLLTGKA